MWGSLVYLFGCGASMVKTHGIELQTDLREILFERLDGIGRKHFRLSPRLAFP